MTQQTNQFTDNLKKAFAAQTFNQDYLTSFREASLEKLAGIPLPTAKNEEWKFVNLKEIFRSEFKPINGTKTVDVSAYLLPESAETTLVFVNGEYRPEQSIVGKLPLGAVIQTFDKAEEKQMHELETHLGAFQTAAEDIFTTINNSFVDNGFFIYVPKETKIESPIYILNIVTREAQNALITSRCLVCADKFSKATLIENFIAIGDAAYLNIPVTELSIAEGASLKHYRVQRDSKKAYHVNRIGTHLEKNSHYESYSIHFGSKFSRSDVRANLAGSEADCTLDGLVLLSDEQESDTHTVMHHQKPHCTSHQLHKVVVDDKSHSVFNGKIWVDKIAQKTDSFQENRNIILSDFARVDTKPQLEIFADDVKCSHGATVGQMDDEELFYLKSRGLNETSAKELLMYGFALEVIENIEIKSLKKQLSDVVSEFAQRLIEPTHA